MKLNYTMALVAAMLGVTVSAGTLAQMGGGSSAGALSRGDATIGGTSGPAPSASTLPLGADRPQLDAAPAYRAQDAVPSVIPGSVPPSAGISSAPLHGSYPPVALPVRPTVPLLATRAMLGIGTSSANPACTGVSADAEVCKGWE